jgi:3-hydroxybutyryl-CoA dehydrogenase
MGLGIAYVAANVTRLPVVLMDVNEAQTTKGLQFMGMCIIMSCRRKKYLK